MELPSAPCDQTDWTWPFLLKFNDVFAATERHRNGNVLTVPSKKPLANR
jgi:hypothetical protein